MRAVLIALALAACAPTPRQGASTEAPPAASAALPTQTPSWETARAAGVDFRAMGQEPGWLLDIYAQDRIVLEWDYAQQSAAFPLPEPVLPRWNGEIYETRNEAHALRIEIRRFPCQDAMSGENYPATVAIVIDGARLNGCGRSV